jgi:hypothetical protein
MSIQEYLLSQGWKPFEDGFLNRWSDLYVDLSGNFGYAWELKQFTDSDVDGVAKARWGRLNEGDTLAELQELV